MNKSYRSVWNESLGAWVAVSELASAAGKRSTAKVDAPPVALSRMGRAVQARLQVAALVSGPPWRWALQAPGPKW